MSAVPEDLLPMLGSGEDEDPKQEERGSLVGDDQAPVYERAAVELDEDEEAALLALVRAIEQADDIPRVEEIRPVLERREAFCGNQLLAWDASERKYVDVIRQMEDEAGPEQDLPTFHKDNFFTPYGLDFIALMIANPIQTSFAPGDPTKPKDVTAAEEGERFVEWVNKQNDSLTLRRWNAKHFWTDGFTALYTRIRADRARFGFEMEPEIGLEMGEVTPERLRCAQCGAEAPLENLTCSACGASLDGAAVLPAEQGLVPRVSRLVEVPKAGVVKTAHGLIEVRKTPGARLVRECGYLELCEDVPRAHAKALYPEKAKEIGDYKAGGVAEEYETSARRGLTYGSSDSRGYLITHKRVWLRQWQLEDVSDEDVRERLKKKFKDGALVVLMGSVLCEAFNESMDDHWTFRYVFPTDAAGIVAAGSAVWDLQQSANELLNLRIEGARQGIPALIANNDILSPDAFAAGRLQPGLIYRGKTPADGGSLHDAVVPTPVANLPAEVGNLEKELGADRAQQRSGIVPALWGGNAGGAGRTLGGYRLMRDQGLMRHGIPWKELEALWNESDLQSVRIYARDGYGDVEVSSQNETGEWGREVISIDSLDGEIRIESDDDAGFPMGPAERKAAWFEYVANPTFAQLVMGPENEGMSWENMGLRDLRFPGQDAREQQRREIDQLLESGPSVDPMTGASSSTVPVDVELEDHAAHAQAIELWANSRDGAKTRFENAAGWENVKAHWREHLVAMGQKQAVAQMLSAPPQAPGPMPGPAGPAIVRQNPMDAPVGPGEMTGAEGLGAPVAM